jgi:hypothetical protein
MDGASGVDSVLIRIIVADSQAVYRVGLIEVFVLRNGYASGRAG